MSYLSCHCLTDDKVGWQSQTVKIEISSKMSGLEYFTTILRSKRHNRQILATIFTESALKLSLYNSGKAVVIYFFMCCLFSSISSPFSFCGK